MKKSKNFLIIIGIFLIGMLTGYENPEKIDRIKKIYKFYFQKKIILEKNISPINEEKNIIETNSFSIKYKTVMEFQDRSASLLVEGGNNKSQNDYRVFTNNGFYETRNKLNEVNLPLSFFNEKNGGIRSVFQIKNEKFALISNKSLNCFYASLIRLSDAKQIIKSECLPDEDYIDFSGLGGGYVNNKESILIAIGTPTHKSREIDLMSQSDKFIFGKILEFKKKDLLDKNLKTINFNFYSKGHRNPQGMAKIGNKIFALEHGPQGGDELNIVKKNKNYGWPIFSYGVPYDKDKKYFHKSKDIKFKQPVYTFLPAVAPSALSTCPQNLKKYYSNNDCLIGLSLRGMSILIFILSKNEDKIVSIEKVKFDQRLRHFGLNNSMNLFENSDSSFYVTADNLKVYELQFTDFINEHVKDR